MLTIQVTGQLMGVVDEERKYVDRESGKASQYQKRVVRLLVGNEFVVCSSREDVRLPDPKESAGKMFNATLSGFSNEKDVIRAVAVEFVAVGK